MEPADEISERRLGQTMGGRWLLTRLLGQGGMAVVYAAHDSQGRSAAIKILHPEMGIRRDIRERFLREAAVMARILHPGMVTIYEQGTDQETAFLAMELLEGEVLTARLRRLGCIPPTEVLTLLDQLLDVLTVAHDLGIIHRDIKPENLFLTHEGRLKVLDFGLARLLFDGPGNFRTRTGAALGTLPYMAPEQALGRRDQIDRRTDLFAVGATAFRLLAARRIHEAPSDAELLMRMASEPAPRLLTVAPHVPVGLAQIVDRALAFAQASRYPSAAAMQADVRAVLAGAEPPYAASEQMREECATAVDRVAPGSRSQPSVDRATAGIQPQSQRQLATVVMPASTRPPSANPPHALTIPQSPRQAIAPTESMRAEQLVAQPPRSPLPVEPTRPDPVPVGVLTSTCPAPLGTVMASAPDTQSPPSAAPLAPRCLSPVAIERQRKRTVIVGVFLVSVLLLTTMVLAILFLGSRWAPRFSETDLPIPVAPKSLAPPRV